MTEVNQRDATREEWKEFEQLCPRNDDVQEWCLDHPLHIPFRNILFGGKLVEYSSYLFAITLAYLIAGAKADTSTIVDPRKAGAKRIQTVAAPGVKWDNRGHPLPNVPHCRITMDIDEEAKAVSDDVTAPAVTAPAPTKRKRVVAISKKSVTTDNASSSSITTTVSNDGLIDTLPNAVLPTKRGKNVKASIVTDQDVTIPEIITVEDLKKCSCSSATACTMQDQDASLSHHKCSLCDRRYFAICMPEIEFNMKMICRFCSVEDKVSC